MTAHRIHTSEPAHRAPTTAWQREREGRVRSAASEDRELAWLALIWMVGVPAIVGLYWLWRAAQ